MGRATATKKAAANAAASKKKGTNQKRGAAAAAVKTTTKKKAAPRSAALTTRKAAAGRKAALKKSDDQVRIDNVRKLAEKNPQITRHFVSSALREHQAALDKINRIPKAQEILAQSLAAKLHSADPGQHDRLRQKYNHASKRLEKISERFYGGVKPRYFLDSASVKALASVKPTRPLTPYMCFAQANRETIKNECKRVNNGVDPDFGPLGQEIGKQWRLLDEEKQAAWKKEAARRNAVLGTQSTRPAKKSSGAAKAGAVKGLRSAGAANTAATGAKVLMPLPTQPPAATSDRMDLLGPGEIRAAAEKPAPVVPSAPVQQTVPPNLSSQSSTSTSTITTTEHFEPVHAVEGNVAA